VKAENRSCGAALRGFTLVELLVSIGIIAVLIGMLMPTLQVVHSRALRVSCASNLRQLFCAVQAYSYASGDSVPLGYDYYSGSNYVAFNNAISGHPRQILGLLDNLNLLNIPSIAFCPAEVDTHFLYDTQNNPWPLGSASYPDSFVGYGTRPNVNWEGCLTVPSPLPKLTQLPPHTAILADTFPTWSALATRHGDGVNVCYSDGSVNYVPANPTLLPLQQMLFYDYDSYNSTYVAQYNNLFLNFSVTPNTGIWAQFDRL
jgi:prepilin-type N-terminal cleavage/methylation domain-containing protein/prepilin-type processing-associated H-X9-DG protein